MTPATMAVSKTGPFFVRWPVSRKAAATSGGSLTFASAVAVLCVAFFAPTSTMVGRLRRSRCVSTRRTEFVSLLAANVMHLDFGLFGRGLPQLRALLAVAVRAVQPDVADQLEQRIVASAAA